MALPATITTHSTRRRRCLVRRPFWKSAASAGFLIHGSRHRGDGPATHIGAAHPVAGNGEKIDDTMAKKMASDVAAYARTLATQRKRNVSLVEQAVLESRSFTEQEAMSANPALIDLIANDVPELVRKLTDPFTRSMDHADSPYRVGTTTNAVMAARVRAPFAHPQSRPSAHVGHAG